MVSKMFFFYIILLYHVISEYDNMAYVSSHLAQAHMSEEYRNHSTDQ